MGYEHSRNIMKIQRRFPQPGLYPAHGNPCVDQNMAVTAAEKQAVAAGPAGKDRKSHQLMETTLSASSGSSGSSTHSMSAPRAFSLPTKFS